ncbi:MAG: transposase [Fimbriimonadaceae bacterium]|nr:transposase [Alphaproteobacteria bacterium]
MAARVERNCFADPGDRNRFIATVLQEWLVRAGIKPIQIYPGSLWENGYHERFNGTLRPEAGPNRHQQMVWAVQ